LADSEDKPRPKDEKTPPGDFLSDDLREETARFINEVKRQIQRRKEPKEEPKLGPPRRDKRR
jgi:hypothetical protein